MKRDHRKQHQKTTAMTPAGTCLEWGPTDRPTGNKKQKHQHQLSGFILKSVSIGIALCPYRRRKVKHSTLNLVQIRCNVTFWTPFCEAAVTGSFHKILCGMHNSTLWHFINCGWNSSFNHCKFHFKHFTLVHNTFLISPFTNTAY